MSKKSADTKNVPDGWTQENWKHYLANESPKMKRRRQRFDACLKVIKSGGTWKQGQAAADKIGPEL